MFIVISDTYNLFINQIDVKRIFLNGDLEIKIYIDQPVEFVIQGNKNKVCKLQKKKKKLYMV